MAPMRRAAPTNHQPAAWQPSGEDREAAEYAANAKERP